MNLKEEVKNNEVKSNVEDLELYSDNFPFRLALRISTFENEVSYKKFLKNTEMLIRRCNEYKLWRNYIIDILQIDTCMITNESIQELTIDVHHHVPSLFTLVSGIVNKKIENNESFCSFDIASESIGLHFKNKIGFITLIKSMHEKFHNGYLDIPIEYVKGDYSYFMNEYGKYLDEVDIDTIQSRLATHSHNCSWVKDEYPLAQTGVS